MYSKQKQVEIPTIVWPVSQQLITGSTLILYHPVSTRYTRPYTGSEICLIG